MPSGGSNLARLGELGGKLLLLFPINRGRMEEQKCPTGISEKMKSLKISEKNHFREDFLPSFVRSSSFFDLEPVSSRNRTF